MLRNTLKPPFPRKRESSNRNACRENFLDPPVKPEDNNLKAFRNKPLFKNYNVLLLIKVNYPKGWGAKLQGPTLHYMVQDGAASCRK